MIGGAGAPTVNPDIGGKPDVPPEPLQEISYMLSLPTCQIRLLGQRPGTFNNDALPVSLALVLHVQGSLVMLRK